MFRTLDTDGDGYVGWSDFQRLVERYCAVFSIDLGGLPGQALRVAYEVEWLEIRRHAGGDERLSEFQFVAAARAAIADTSRFDILGSVPQVIFDVMDRDGDDVVDETVFTGFLRVWQIPVADGLAAFTAMDRDGDRLVSRNEFVDSVRRFHDDEDKAGSLYFGDS